jgi:type III secretory pathway component EscU
LNVGLNPSTHVEILTFCILEWLTAFNYVTYFLLSCFIAVNSGSKYRVIKYCVGKGYNVVAVIEFSQQEASTYLPLTFLGSLLQVFTVVVEHNVV